MTLQRPYPWEKSYPKNVKWDAALPTMTLPAMLENAIASYSSRTAIEYRDKTITFSALGEMARRMANGLRKLGLGPGKQVALYLPNSPYHPATFFGGLKTGGHLVHLSPLDAERELAFKLKDSGARILVTTNIGPMLPMALKLADAGLVDHVVVGDDTEWGTHPAVPTVPIVENGDKVVSAARLMSIAPAPKDWPQLEADDVALLQYTGGTTGAPKGAMLTHANLTSAVAIYDAWYEGQGLLKRGGEKMICVLPLFHIYSLTVVLLRYLNNGNEILMRLRFDPETAARDIETKRATAMCGVPTMWIGLVSHPGIEKRDFSSLNFCQSGGGPIPPEVVQRFIKLTGRWLGAGWGMTETSPAGTNMAHGSDFKPGSIGLPLPGIYMDVVALDDSRRLLKPGETGEIRIKGPNVTQGYWNRPEETRKAFVDGLFLTGDIGYMDEGGNFYLVDRKKDMIISGGFNVFPRLVEDAIYEHPSVQEVIVIGIPDQYRGESAKAFVKLREGKPKMTLDELRLFLSDKLGKYEMPTELEIRDVLPKTAVGKLSKKELVEEERAKRQPTAPVARAAN